MTGQRFIQKDGRCIDVLSFRVEPEDIDVSDLMEKILKDLEEEEGRVESLSEDRSDGFGPELVELYFDITAGYTAARNGR